MKVIISLSSRRKKTFVNPLTVQEKNTKKKSNVDIKIEQFFQTRTSIKEGIILYPNLALYILCFFL